MVPLVTGAILVSEGLLDFQGLQGKRDLVATEDLKVSRGPKVIWVYLDPEGLQGLLDP